MKSARRADYQTRNSIMQLLSDDEVAAVSTAETGTRLADGEEYLDLERLDQGVRRANRTASPMGRVLARNAVHATTWSKIVMQLGSAARFT